VASKLIDKDSVGDTKDCPMLGSDFSCMQTVEFHNTLHYPQQQGSKLADKPSEVHARQILWSGDDNEGRSGRQVGGWRGKENWHRAATCRGDKEDGVQILPGLSH